MSDSVRPHRQQPTRLLCPLNSLGKNTGVGCHFLLIHINNFLKCKWIKWTNQRQTGWVDENVHLFVYAFVCVCIPLTIWICLTPQIVCNYFILLIRFLLCLAIVIIFYFLSSYWLWKLINIFYYCEKKKEPKKKSTLKIKKNQKLEGRLRVKKKPI